MELIKLSYDDVRKQGFGVTYQSSGNYYGIKIDDTQILYVYAYENYFHNQHVYMNMLLNSIASQNLNEVFKTMRNYFKKDLQVMISSEKIVVDALMQGGFYLERKCYECSYQFFDMNDISKKSFDISIVEASNIAFEAICRMSFEHYQNTHKAVNPVTVSFEVFKTKLPKQAYAVLNHLQVVCVAFYEADELCYFYSLNEDDFDDFIHQVLCQQFHKYTNISFEADDTDPLALKVMNHFKHRPISAFNTYVFKG